MGNEIIKMYPEFGLTVKYIPDDEVISIDWVVSDADGELLMSGRFDSTDFYKSTFTIYPSNLEENIYENLFYLYFENIKLACIEMVEFKDEEGRQMLEDADNENFIA